MHTTLIQQVIDELKTMPDPLQQQVLTYIRTLKTPTPSLLNQPEIWQGSDFEECLATVYQTRSQIQP